MYWRYENKTTSTYGLKNKITTSTHVATMQLKEQKSVSPFEAPECHSLESAPLPTSPLPPDSK